eukprot:COSAG02_NODE_5079_length_4659_cov_2.238596_3_plen_139_part_00
MVATARPDPAGHFTTLTSDPGRLCVTCESNDDGFGAFQQTATPPNTSDLAMRIDLSRQVTDVAPVVPQCGRTYHANLQLSTPNVATMRILRVMNDVSATQVARIVFLPTMVRRTVDSVVILSVIRPGEYYLRHRLNIA